MVFGYFDEIALKRQLKIAITVKKINPLFLVELLIKTDLFAIYQVPNGHLL